MNVRIQGALIAFILGMLTGGFMERAWPAPKLTSFSWMRVSVRWT